MQELAQLESLRDPATQRRRWPAELEQRFRKAQRRSHRGLRTLLFSVHALCIGGAPLYGRALYLPSDRVEPWLSLSLIIAGLLLATTAVLTWRAVDAVSSKVLQVVCVFVSGLGVVLLRYLALQGDLNFPPHMVSVVIVSLLIFGGYAWKRMAIGAISCFSLTAFIELRFTPTEAMAQVQVLCLGLMALAMIVHVRSQEAMARSSWIDRRYANALARTDALTGLSTRNYFNWQFDSRLAQARRDARRVALLILDVDHFKRINDRHGHLFGDEVLRAIGAVLSQGFAQRPLDLRMRFGGEEMVIFWYDLDEARLPALAESLLAAIRAIELVDPLSQQVVPITVSIGLTSVVPDDTTQPLSLLRRADELLYQAKAQGRDRVVIGPYRVSTESDSAEHALVLE